MFITEIIIFFFHVFLINLDLRDGFSYIKYIKSRALKLSRGVTFAIMHKNHVYKRVIILLFEVVYKHGENEFK